MVIDCLWLICYKATWRLIYKERPTMRTIDTTKRFTRLIRSKLGIKGDFGLPDIGISKRYAYLELQNMGLVPTGHKKTFLSGHDLLALMYRIEQRIKAEERESSWSFGGNGKSAKSAK